MPGKGYNFIENIEEPMLASNRFPLLFEPRLKIDFDNIYLI